MFDRLAGPFDQVEDGQPVASSSQTDNLAFTYCGCQGMLPKILARVQIRQVHFNDRDRDGSNSVSQRHRRMRIATGIKDHAIEVFCFGPVELIDQRAFVVALDEFQSNIWKRFPKHFFQVLERGSAVNRRFPLAEQIQIGAVEYENFHNGYWGYGLYLRVRPR